jgi:glycosyltransferase involved in cell wall biosynthesis
MIKLSAVLCVHNEERRLARCLDALGFADEIVLVLDRCTDRTRAIGEAYGAVMISGVFPLEGPRRAAGMAAASGAWILEVDADEIVTPQMAREVLDALDDAHVAFRKVPIDNYVGARLYRKGTKRWGGERVHPKVVFDGAQGANLAHGLRHQFGENVSDVVRRLDRYTELKSQDLREHGGKLGVADNARRGLQRFWKCYVRRGGWREGGWGLLISLMAGLYPLLSALRVDLERPAAALSGQADAEPTALAQAA